MIWCGVDAAAPRPERMEPSTGSASASVPVVIRGEGFLLRPVQEQSGSGAELVAGHRAWLGDVELVDVVWVDTRTLHATVPPGLAPGVKQLVVENAFGRRGALDRAFEVTPGAVLEATLGAEPATFNVGEPGTLTLSVRNIGGAAVRNLVPDPVALTGTAAVGAEVNGPAPASAARLQPGAAVDFTWSVTPALPGSLSLATSVQGTDDPSSLPVSSPVALVSAEVQMPAVLAAQLDEEGAVRVGLQFAVTLVVVNTGQAGVLVTRVEPSVAPRDVATCGLPAPLPPLSIEGLGTRTFSWSCTPHEDGNFAVLVVVAGVDANSGSTVEARAELRLRAR